jgi:ribosomal protein S18 acetylase RimI-like enzyme
MTNAAHMQYRRATEADAPLIAEINRQLIDAEWGGGGMSLERLEARARDWITEGEYHAILFLADGGDTAAYALFTADEESAYIRHFYVMPAHRGDGVGSRCIETLFRDIIAPTARVTLDVLASNGSGCAFWRSVGFRDYSIRMERLPAEGAGAG